MTRRILDRSDRPSQDTRLARFVAIERRRQPKPVTLDLQRATPYRARLRRVMTPVFSSKLHAL